MYIDCVLSFHGCPRGQHGDLCLQHSAEDKLQQPLPAWPHNTNEMEFSPRRRLDRAGLGRAGLVQTSLVSRSGLLVYTALSSICFSRGSQSTCM